MNIHHKRRFFLRPDLTLDFLVSSVVFPRVTRCCAIFTRHWLQCQSSLGCCFILRHERWATLEQPSQQITFPPSSQMQQYSSHSLEPASSLSWSELSLSSLSLASEESFTDRPNGFLPFTGALDALNSDCSDFASSSSSLLYYSLSDESKYFTNSPLPQARDKGLAEAWGFLLMSLLRASAAFLLIFKAFSVYRITNCSLILSKISTLILTAKRLLSRDCVYLRNASCRSQDGQNLKS